jgi:hypothetical protein
VPFIHAPELVRRWGFLPVVPTSKYLFVVILETVTLFFGSHGKFLWILPPWSFLFPKFPFLALFL